MRGPSSSAIDSMAFVIRFRSTCCSWIRSPATCGSRAPASICTSIRCFCRSPRNKTRASPMRSLMSSEVLLRASRLKIARMLPITAPARCPSAAIFLNAALASSRSGVGRSSQRKPASAFVIIPDNGCLTSWAIVAATASPVISRASRSRRWARTARSNCA